MRTSNRRDRPSHAALGVAVIAGVALLGCSSSAANSAVDVIEGQIAEEAGLGELDATCTEPDGLVEGETFTCTATTDDGQVLQFVGTMTSDDEFDVNSTNVLAAADIEAIRADAATALSAEFGLEIVPDDIVCPDAALVIDESGEFLCEITDTATGDVFELRVETGVLTPGEINQPVYFIGEQLR